VIDLGGDVRANPKLSGTKHNVFGIQTGVAISFLVKRRGVLKKSRIVYSRRSEMETREDKLGFLSTVRLSALDMTEVNPDNKHVWLNQTKNDFELFIPTAQKEAKASKTAGQEKAIFKLYSLGIATNRDEWAYSFDKVTQIRKSNFFQNLYDQK
jgi:predicted helicase